MARLSLSQSPKFKVLVRSLGLPTPYVRGYLELFWESAHFRDDPYFESLDEIEAAADWQGESGLFGRTLLDRKWIEAKGSGFIIHDYEEHLPSYVAQRRNKANYRASKRGQSQDKDGLSQDSPKTVSGQSDQEEENRNGMKEKRKETPEELPIGNSPSGKPKDVPEFSEPFKLFWDQYPPAGKTRYKGKKQSYEVWRKQKLDDRYEDVMKSLDNFKMSSKWTKDDGQYIDSAFKWLNNGLWEEGVRY